MSDALTQLSAAEEQFGESEAAARNYLNSLSDHLAATCSRADIHCSGDNLVLDQYTEDEWTFGHLYCNYNGLYIGASDSTQAMNLMPGEEQTFSLTKIKECPIAWVRSISKREVIEAFLKKVQKELLRRTDELRTQVVELAAVALPAERAASREFEDRAKSLGFDRIAPKRVSFDEGLPLPQLVDATRAALGLETKSAKTDPLGKVSAGLTTVLQNIGALRNSTSDAHGRGLDYKEATRAQARLAVNAAGTIATYLLEQWKLIKDGPAPSA